ncbi:hypothetical protein [Thiolapillus sp.]|uniref:hypothetical protein n=1 Tax=Thiolapillus sp. TaxID=2017437 RepID=UPI003AF90509
MPNYDKFPVNYDKFPVGICVVWITFVFAIVPRETFGCWFFVALPLCRSAGLSAGRSAVLLVSVCLTVFCLSAGLCAALLAFLPLCWRVACALVYRATAGCLSLCLPVPGVLLLVVTLLPAADLCRLHLLAGLSLLPSFQFGSPC